MKVKFIFLIFCVICLCGCQNIKNVDISQITSRLEKNIDNVNTYRIGYSYYIPVGMASKEYTLYNDVIETNDYLYYLYVDLISFYNKSVIDYNETKDAYYSKEIKTGEKRGYIEINLQENNQYLIEIMFNYAKIEVMVDYKDINVALSYAVSILRSIEYNGNVIANLLDKNVLSFQEEIYNVFNTTSSDSTYLKALEEELEEQETEIKDKDYVN